MAGGREGNIPYELYSPQATFKKDYSVLEFLVASSIKATAGVKSTINAGVFIFLHFISDSGQGSGRDIHLDISLTYLVMSRDSGPGRRGR
jgi:hypothetical protein